MIQIFTTDEWHVVTDQTASVRENNPVSRWDGFPVCYLSVRDRRFADYQCQWVPRR